MRHEHQISKKYTARNLFRPVIQETKAFHLIILFALLGSLSLQAAGEDLVTYVKTTFDSGDTGTLKKAKNLYFLPKTTDVHGNPYLFITAYPKGSKPRRLKPLPLKEPALGAEAFSFEADDAKDILMSFSGLREAPGKKFCAGEDLWVALWLYTEADTGYYYLTLWNSAAKKKRRIKLKTAPGKWQLVKQRIFGPGFFAAGDPVSSISIQNRGSVKRCFYIDNFVVWRGKDTSPPEKVSGVEVKNSDNANIVTWQPASDNLFVAKYRIYRGSIPVFTPDVSNLIGESLLPEFRDEALLHPPYHYIIVAEDLAGNLSVPSAAASVGNSNTGEN